MTVDVGKVSDTKLIVSFKLPLQNTASAKDATVGKAKGLLNELVSLFASEPENEDPMGIRAEGQAAADEGPGADAMFQQDLLAAREALNRAWMTFYTQRELANYRYNQNVNDAFYQGEIDYYDAIGPQLDALQSIGRTMPFGGTMSMANGIRAAPFTIRSLTPPPTWWPWTIPRCVWVSRAT